MSLDRRTFLAATPLSSARMLGANDRLRCATIGTGNRGTYLTRQFKEFGAEMAAVCDVYEPRLEQGLEAASTGAPELHPPSDLLVIDEIELNRREVSY